MRELSVRELLKPVQGVLQIGWDDKQNLQIRFRLPEQLQGYEYRWDFLSGCSCQNTPHGLDQPLPVGFKLLILNLCNNLHANHGMVTLTDQDGDPSGQDYLCVTFKEVALQISDFQDFIDRWGAWIFTNYPRYYRCEKRSDVKLFWQLVGYYQQGDAQAKIRAESNLTKLASRYGIFPNAIGEDTIPELHAAIWG